MRNLVDILITEYRSVDHNTPVVEKIAQANERLASIFTRLLGLIAAINIAQRSIDFAGNATKAASEYISLEARMKALVGTFEDAQRKLKMAELVAAPSPFTTKQLADAAVTLEAFGLNSERILPILGKLGAAMGATNEKMQMFTRGFGKLGQGEMIESDVLAAMGINKGDFAAKGIKFDGSGKLQSSALESLQALEKIINERFGNILEEMANTPEARRASLEDAGQKIMRSIGTGLLKANAPFMDALTKLFDGLNNSKVIDEVTNKLSGAFLSVFGGDASDTLARFAAKFLAFLYLIPDSIAVIKANVSEAWMFLGSLFTNIAEKAKFTFSLMVDGVTLVVQSIEFLFNTLFSAQIQGFQNLLKVVGVAGPIADFLTKIMPAPMLARGIGDSIKGELGMVFDAYKLGLTGIDVMNPIHDPKFQGMPDFGSKETDFYNKIKRGMAQGAGSIPDTSGQSFFTRQPVSSDEDKLGAIARNTGDTARNTEKFDVGKLLFGGGDRAALGISLADIGTSGSALTRRGRTGFGGYGVGSFPQTKIDLGQPTNYAEAFVAETLQRSLPIVLRMLGVVTNE